MAKEVELFISGFDDDGDFFRHENFPKENEIRFGFEGRGLKIDTSPFLSKLRRDDVKKIFESMNLSNFLGTVISTDSSKIFAERTECVIEGLRPSLIFNDWEVTYVKQ